MAWLEPGQGLPSLGFSGPGDTALLELDGSVLCKSWVDFHSLCLSFLWSLCSLPI